MITLQHSLNSLLFAATLFSASAFAEPKYCPQKFDVLEREEGSKYKFTPQTLEYLFCNNSFEGEYFKLVQGTSNEAIRFDTDNKELIKRAANVYYHLTVARQFWMSEIKSEFVSKLPQITVRIDITNSFSNIRHFKNAEQEKNYNNAWSIPSGETPAFIKEKMKWGKEIWFSPMKKIESRKNVVSDGNNPIHESLQVIKDPIVDYNTSALIYQGLGALAYPDLESSATVETALGRVGAIAVMYGLIYTTKRMDKWFIDKYYFIDTAMVPEIIYHEYAHIAMSDTMKTVHSVPVIEGMADYFATRVANREKMYAELDGYSNNRPKDIKNKSYYSPYLEGSWNATSDFTLSLIWKAREKFDEANEKRAKKGQDPMVNFDEMVHDAHFLLNENSDIAHGLTKALIDTCRKECANSRAGINILQGVFEIKGMN